MIGSITCRFLVECLWNILFKKCGISNQPVTASVMIRVFPSLEHSTEGVRKPQTILGLLCVSLIGTTEQNITARSRCLNWHLPCFQ